MGQSQSANVEDGFEDSALKTRKIDYYELLNVEPDASGEE